jgi:hypothetical protein
MHNYRGTSWKRKTTHPLPFTGFVMPLTDTGDRTVHHGIRIAKDTGQDER